MVNVLGHPAVNYVATVPGNTGVAVAFGAEIIITFVLMLTVLAISNHARLSRFTGLFAGALVATFIIFEAPISGMSMNPARTFAAAFSGNIWTAIWIYFTAPLIGMLLAAEAYLRHAGVHKIFCAKLHHHNDKHLGTIIAPPHIHNMAWGDEDGKTLYLCARHGLYKIRLNIAGVRPREMTKQ